MLVNAVQDYAIFSLDPAGIVQTWNAGAERSTGYTSSEIVGQHFSRFYSRDAVAAGKPEAEPAAAARTGRFSEENRRLREDGTPLWARVVISPLYDPASGTLLGFAKLTRDLTGRRQTTARLLEERAARAASDRARMRSTFLAALGKALAESRGLKSAISRMARLALPMLGDYCIVDLRTTDGQTELLTLAHVDPSMQHLVEGCAASRLRKQTTGTPHPACCRPVSRASPTRRRRKANRYGP